MFLSGKYTNELRAVVLYNNSAPTDWTVSKQYLFQQFFTLEHLVWKIIGARSADFYCLPPLVSRFIFNFTQLIPRPTAYTEALIAANALTELHLLFFHPARVNPLIMTGIIARWAVPPSFSSHPRSPGLSRFIIAYGSFGASVYVPRTNTRNRPPVTTLPITPVSYPPR